MNINFKIALPSLIGLVLIVLLIQNYWLPLQLEKAKITFEKHTHELLVLGETGIIQNLLQRDYGALFSSMEYLEKSHENQWLNITLNIEDGKQVYPLLGRHMEATDQNKELIHIVYPLEVNRTRLGHLELDIDWGNKKLSVMESIIGVRDMVVWMLLLCLLVTVISQYRIIYRPLQKLGRATDKIAQGNFNVELPVTTKDEIGALTNSFNTMMVELAFQKKALDQHAVVSTADQDGVITYVNNKFLDISGYAREELIGNNHRVIKSNIHPPEFYKEMWETITHGNVWQGEICNLSKAGEKFWLSSTIVPFLDKQGVPKHYVAIRTDITERKHAEEQLKHMANHDALTGLPTRRLGKESISHALAVARRYESKVAVMFLDLDGFKAVNDTLGHEVGDLLLMGAADRLSHCVREVDTVARIGGDEFMIVLSSIKHCENAALVAQKIIDALAQPFMLGDKTVSIGTSIGIAIYPDHEQEPEALLRLADEAMYIVKGKGKNNFALYEDV